MRTRVTMRSAIMAIPTAGIASRGHTASRLNSPPGSGCTWDRKLASPALSTMSGHCFTRTRLPWTTPRTPLAHLSAARILLPPTDPTVQLAHDGVVFLLGHQVRNHAASADDHEAVWSVHPRPLDGQRVAREPIRRGHDERERHLG
eukprot:7388485-Prymnesium_polylepis.1